MQAEAKAAVRVSLFLLAKKEKPLFGRFGRTARCRLPLVLRTQSPYARMCFDYITSLKAFWIFLSRNVLV